MAAAAVAEHDQASQYTIMIVVTIIATTWTVLTMLIFAACRAARLGDQTQLEPSSSAAPQPDIHVVRRRRHTAALPTGPRLPYKLPVR
jgi:hypothetical protein